MTTGDKQAVSRQQVTGHVAEVEDMREDMVTPMLTTLRQGSQRQVVSEGKSK